MLSSKLNGPDPGVPSSEGRLMYLTAPHLIRNIITFPRLSRARTYLLDQRLQDS